MPLSLALPLCSLPSPLLPTHTVVLLAISTSVVDVLQLPVVSQHRRIQRHAVSLPSLAVLNIEQDARRTSESRYQLPPIFIRDILRISNTTSGYNTVTLSLHISFLPARLLSYLGLHLNHTQFVPTLSTIPAALPRPNSKSTETVELFGNLLRTPNFVFVPRDRSYSLRLSSIAQKD